MQVENFKFEKDKDVNKVTSQNNESNGLKITSLKLPFSEVFILVLKVYLSSMVIGIIIMAIMFFILSILGVTILGELGGIFEQSYSENKSNKRISHKIRSYKPSRVNLRELKRTRVKKSNIKKKSSSYKRLNRIKKNNKESVSVVLYPKNISTELLKLSKKGYELYLKKRYTGIFKGGHYTDPDPEAKGSEFWSNGKDAIIKRITSKGYTKIKFKVSGKRLIYSSRIKQGKY